MFQKNLKYYRLKNNLTKAAFASMVGVTPMAITNYENGSRRQDMATVKALAKALGVKTVDFLAVRNENLIFTHEEFRKNNKLTQAHQEYIREAVEEYFSRFFEVIELLGGEVLPPQHRNCTHLYFLKIRKQMEWLLDNILMSTNMDLSAASLSYFKIKAF